MNKSWRLIPKILSGKKTIESRWYLSRRTPWGRIASGDTVYFKDVGAPVVAKAAVSKVLQFCDLSPNKVKDIWSKYGDGIGTDNVKSLAKWSLDKKYCILVFLRTPQLIPSFNINKTGFGNATAWLTVDNIDQIRVKS